MIELIIVSTIFIFLIIRLLVVLYNLSTQPLLPFYGAHSSNKKVSILIPCRNEEKNIGNLLNQLTGFDDDNVTEIIVLDDFSTDNTNIIVQNFAHKFSKLKLIEGKELPKGWLGKNWACHQLVAQSKGDYLVFLDADISITKTCISNSIKRMQLFDLKVFSLFPDQKMETWGEKLVVPLMHYLLLSLLPLRLVRTSKLPSLSAANGQFIAFERSTYNQYQFHEKVKNNVLDDVNIMRFAKEMGLKVEVLLGNGQIYCRMYTNLKDAIAGFSKNLFAGFGNNLPGIFIYFVFIIFGITYIIFTGNNILFCACVLNICFIRLGISILSRQSILRNILLNPIQMVLYLIIGVSSVQQYYTKNTYWKGRKIT
ncbi:MAG: glycosyltransferase [Bacteroidota bacterium]|nr:glycosyltransferase [Bacteroidota bacterium]